MRAEKEEKERKSGGEEGKEMLALQMQKKTTLNLKGPQHKRAI